MTTKRILELEVCPIASSWFHRKFNFSENFILGHFMKI